MGKRHLKIGIWLDSNYKPTEGGGFSYYDKLVRNIDNHSFPPEVEIVFLTESACKTQLKKQVLKISVLNRLIKYDSIIQKCIPKLFKHFRKIRRLMEMSYYNSLFKKKNIDVLYYLKQEECYVSDYPFIATNWDIGHISTYPFPEIAKDIKRRKRFYEKILTKAIFVFCESEAGKEELKKYTSLDEFKIRVIPLFSGNNSNQIINEDSSFFEKYNFSPNTYYFYPAQFWAHKNHYGLLLAFSRIVSDFPDLKLVLTGSDKGNLKYIKNIISDLGIEKNVIILGFVSTNELYLLYKNAIALVMPTYLGPTNMPPIEAMEFNCPVICSDLSGHREILGDAALYFEPQDTFSIEKMMRSMLNEEFRKEFIKKLSLRNNESIFKIEYSIKKIETFLLELSYIRKTWK